MLEKNIDYVKKTTDEMIYNIEMEIGKEMAIKLLPEIVKRVGLESEEQLGRLTNMVRITSNTIQDRIKRNTNTRTLNLTNNFHESYKTVEELNEKTRNTTAFITADDKAKSVKKMVKKAS